VVVVGDLVLDTVLVPSRPLETGTDVPGRVSIRQGGSAANTARWLARLGARTSLVAAVGRDPNGRALVEEIRSDGVRPRVVRARRPADRPDGVPSHPAASGRSWPTGAWP
jgi:sugar/nucleoside kinase (ribokinase family)